MRVGILGPLDVVAGERSVPIGGARLRVLLIRLALDAGRVVTVDALCDALWPDGGPGAREHALHTLVSRLRRTLPDRSAIRSAAGGYLLDVPPDAVDALRFERLAGEGRRALRDGAPDVAAARLGAALGLWRGAALADVAREPFATAITVRLDELRIAAVEDRVAAELDTAAGRGDPVAELAELIAAHPLRERSRVLQVRALHAAGRTAEALNAYEEARVRLADELGADPGPELIEAHRVVLHGEQPPRRPRGEHPRGNLRTALTSLIGREPERQRVQERLATGRLATLVGPGGVGKTRLATGCAADLAADAPGGVWLVELAPVTDPADVPNAVLGVLGPRETAVLDASSIPRDSVNRLIEALPADETLLVLDNCEHLIDAAARLADELLGRCPQLRILATSREPLGIPGEALCPVPPLGVPGPDAAAEEIVASPAVRLFTERAAAVRPGSTGPAPDSDTAAVGEICRRLDGLPLAIELAVARLRSLTVRQLAARLDDRFQMLTGGSRTALPRHRTLRAVVAWSWDLLDAEERRFAERLAVFGGTITPDGAAAVCGAPGTALDTLSDLVDKSLLQMLDAEEPRYRMLDTIREFGLERLAESGGVASAKAAHAAYALDLAERAEPELRGAGQMWWLTRLAVERDNLTAALRHAGDLGDAEVAVRLGAALGYFWAIRGEHTEAADRLRRALELPGGTAQRARPAAVAAYLLNAVLSGDTGPARPGAGPRGPGDTERPDAAAWLDAGPHAGGHPAGALVTALLALLGDDIAAGLTVIDARQPHPDAWTRAMLWFVRALLSGSDGDMARMGRDFGQAAEGFRAAGERWGLAMSLTFRATAQVTVGAFDDAVAALDESIGLAQELGVPGFPRVWRAMVRVQTGDVELARAELLDVLTAGGSARDLALARIQLADLARYEGDPDEAGRQMDRAAEQLGDSAFDDAMFRTGLGWLALARGEAREAGTQLHAALRLAVRMPDMPMASVVGVALARLRLRNGDASGAARLLGAAHALRGAPDAHHPDVRHLVTDLRTELDDPAYQAAYDRGRALSRPEALAAIQSDSPHGAG